MTQAKHGDAVRVHYTGKLNDGTVFASTANREPIQFRIGTAQAIEGFEQAVIGMKPGESKTTRVPAGKAFGPYRDDQVIVVNRDRLPADLQPTVGQELQIPQAGNKPPLTVRVTHVSESEVTLDGNHPLAGKDLTFDIHLVDIV